MHDRIKSRREQEVTARTGREIPELIRELYVDQKFSDREIAEALGVHRVTVTNWRRAWSITRDDRPVVAL